MKKKKEKRRPLLAGQVKFGGKYTFSEEKKKKKDHPVANSEEIISPQLFPVFPFSATSILSLFLFLSLSFCSKNDQSRSLLSVPPWPTRVSMAKAEGPKTLGPQLVMGEEP